MFSRRSARESRARLAVVPSIGLAIAISAGPASAASVTFIPDQAGVIGPQITAISGDGEVVAGSDLFLTGWRRSQATGVVLMPTFPGSPNDDMVVEDASDDGSVLVGQAFAATDWEAFRWTEAGGLVSLDASPADLTLPYGVSADGSVVVGQKESSAFRWTQAGGFEILDPALPTFNVANDVSGDGTIVVGTANGAAFRWTAASGMVALGPLAGDEQAAGEAISADGSVIVGSSFDDDTQTGVVFRWTSGSGLVSLGRPTGTDHATPVDVSGDGNVIVGTAGAELQGGELFQVAFVWTPTHGMRTLEEHLNLVGGVPDGLSAADVELTGVSDDGYTIVGFEFTQVQLRSVIVDLRPSVPLFPALPVAAPSLLALALLVTGARALRGGRPRLG